MSHSIKTVAGSGGFRGGAPGVHPFAILTCVLFKSAYLLTCLFTAIMASFGKKVRAQEAPKFLPADAYPGLQIYQNCFCSRGSTARFRWWNLQCSPDPIAGLRGLLLRGRKGMSGGRGGESCAPLSQIPGSAPGNHRIQNMVDGVRK